MFKVLLGMDYAQIPSLHSRRVEANKRFFFSYMSHPSSCLFPLLPPHKDDTIISRLRSASIRHRPEPEQNVLHLQLSISS